MKKSYLLSFALLLFLVPKAQTTVTLTADKDNTIYSGTVNNSNGSGAYFFVGRNGGNNGNSLQRALLHFNTGTIPAGAVISSATLTLYSEKVGGVQTGIALHKLTANWGEGASDAIGNEGPGAAAATGDATWNQSFFPGTNWATPGGVFNATQTAVSGNVTGGSVVTLSNASLIADVQSWVSNAATNFGWIIRASDEAPSNSAKKFVSRNSTTATQRPSLSITYTSAVPVTLKAFSASIKNNNAVVEWKTVTEVNNQYFDVEHSSNGTDFTSIGRVNGSGNSTSEHSYMFTHNNISGGKHYYRLAQHDVDGGVKYSQVVLLSLSSKANLQVSPNPAVSVINIVASSSLHGASYIIHSASGQITKKGTLQSQQVDVQQLSSGQYWLTIQGADGEILKTSFLKK